MRIGQIVFIKGQTLLKAQTGIIVRKEYEHTLEEWWYEVLCDDRCNHVLPGHLLSPAKSRVGRGNKKSQINVHNFLHASTKHTKFQLHYIHNAKQKLKTFTHK